MRSPVAAFAAALIAFAFCQSAHAGKPKNVVVTNFPPTQNVNVVGGCEEPGRLAGFTAAQLTGNQGLLGFAAACVSEFAGSRVCSTRDIARTTAVPGGLSGSAWLVPELIGAAGTLTDSVTGNLAGIAQNSTCNGWSQGSGALGHVIDAQGRFFIDDCAEPRSVACCVGE